MKTDAEFDRLTAECQRLREALQYGVDLHTPGAADGPMYHHETLFLMQAKAAMACTKVGE